VPRYVELSMPRAEAKRLLELAAKGAEMTFFPQDGDQRIVARLEAALRGKDLRVANQHNTHKVKRPRVELDLRRRSA
jgi:hypothetical protein